MLRLRPYKKCDAERIVGWITDEETFWKWCAGQYEKYPVTAQDMNDKYEGLAFSDAFYPMTAFDESGAVGHLIMRFTDAEKKRLRFGFIIVDGTKRGRGYGREMLRLAAKYAFEILKAERVTLGVFENNPAARGCYGAAGFAEVPGAETVHRLMGEDWSCLEMELEP